MKIEKTVKINQSAEEVWDILGPNYEHADKWASAVYLSNAKHGKTKLTDAPVAGRVCQTSLGPFSEDLVKYNTKTFNIAYSATGEKMPGFMKLLVNSWQVIPKGSHACEVTMQLNAEIAQPFRFLMGWMMKLQFNGALTDSIEDLRVYAETGKPSEKKRQVDQSKKAMAAKAGATN